MASGELVVGLVLGAAAALAVHVSLGWWRRRRDLRQMLAELRSLELPLVLIEFPSRRVHLSPALIGELATVALEDLDVDAAIDAFVEAQDQARARQLVDELRTGVRTVQEAEFKLRFRDGRWHSVMVQVFRLGRGVAGRQWVIATVVDHSRAYEIEEERDRLFNLSLDLLAVGDLNGRQLQVNPAWVRVLRWSRDDIMARTFVELVHPDDRERARQAQDELRCGIPVRDLELRTLCRDSSFRWISWSSFPLTARQTVFTVARDITDRKAAEEQLHRYQVRLQQLASQLATVEERQNRRLAEILHDTLAQDLFAAQAKLSLLKYPDRLADPAAVLREASEILDYANQLTRTLTFELFPPALYDVGLDAALEWLCRSFRKTRGLECLFVCDGEPVDLSQDLRTLLYQGARELLANVYKHAEATRAEVRLMYTDRSVVLTVDDDGRGFELGGPGAGQADEPAESGFGLFNIRERLGQLAGSLSIGSSSLGGGRVTIVLPRAAGAI
ncbi:MAG TPA: PAS domain S-box protein [Candidatus Krumholzibacteria bacterium]|nr:PAS domain S-box protein [Candidatus Krumholzibacteria bacterium]HPD71670.1 PAS domain S-box protein [Candidatus Krumholzibacteria bacterium]HRY41397.1 PAS domain S-box protein [Candidatus Krumholzibacteria bacterium]